MIGLYVGGYLCMLTGGVRLLRNRVDPDPYGYAPIYRFGGKLTESFFEPAHQIDHKIRPDYWRDAILDSVTDGEVPFSNP